MNGNLVIYNEIPVIFPNSFSPVNVGHEKHDLIIGRRLEVFLKTVILSSKNFHFLMSIF